jgi:hypothetical protein
MTVVKMPLDKDKLLKVLKLLQDQESKMHNRTPTKDWIDVVNKIRAVKRSLECLT